MSQIADHFSFRAENRERDEENEMESSSDGICAREA